MSSLNAGRLLLAASQVFYGIGTIVADYSQSHIHNPRWPPHAKFHNGQTMSLSTLLAATSLWILFRPPLAATASTPTANTSSSSSSSSSNGNNIKQQQRDLLLAAWIGSLYMLAGLTAIWYPGTAWADPEFRQVRDVDEPVQLRIFGGGLVVLWVGWWLEWGRLREVLLEGNRKEGTGKGR